MDAQKDLSLFGNVTANLKSIAAFVSQTSGIFHLSGRVPIQGSHAYMMLEMGTFKLGCP